MGTINIVNKQVGQIPSNITYQSGGDDPNQLSTYDLEYLLTILKNTTLKGEQIEHFYNLVVKLQNQYIILTKKS